MVRARLFKALLEQSRVELNVDFGGGERVLILVYWLHIRTTLADYVCW
jgi:hypothetical protein